MVSLKEEIIRFLEELALEAIRRKDIDVAIGSIILRAVMELVEIPASVNIGHIISSNEIVSNEIRWVAKEIINCRGDEKCLEALSKYLEELAKLIDHKK